MCPVSFQPAVYTWISSPGVCVVPRVSNRQLSMTALAQLMALAQNQTKVQILMKIQVQTQTRAQVRVLIGMQQVITVLAFVK